MTDPSVPPRRPYRRETEAKRRAALIAAALHLVSEDGGRAATVRSIADKAGVTAGLIRHYFGSKDELIAQSYRSLMDTMTANTAAVLSAAPNDPAARLGCFVAASLRPPVIDPDALRLWASFMQQVLRDPAMREIHRQTYLNFRNKLQDLIAALPHPRSPAELRALAIAGNAVIDGLWMEGCALPDAFADDELVRIGLHSIGAMVGVNLTTTFTLGTVP